VTPVVVWKFDRLGRFIQHLIEVVTSLGERGVGFRSLTEGFDTTTITTGGKLLFHVLGALVHFERDLIRERTLAGLAIACAAGRTGRRRPKLTDRQMRRPGRCSTPVSIPCSRSPRSWAWAARWCTAPSAGVALLRRRYDRVQG
jgi:hypothetical protein